MFSRDGAFNAFLGLFGIDGQAVGQRPRLRAVDADRCSAVWQFGAPMVIFLAGLKQIPTELYEAAVGRRRRRGGASSGTSRCRCLSPVIFFNLVLETIHGFQGFTVGVRRLSGGTGGPVDSTLMYTLYLYHRGLHRLPDGLRLGDGVGVPVAIGADHRRALPHRPVLGALPDGDER